MAKGQPDFFGTSIFPQYGVFNIYSYSWTTASTGTYTMRSLDFKGLVIGGFLRISNVAYADRNKMYPQLWVDGINYFSGTLNALLATGLFKTEHDVMRLTTYRVTAGEYVLSFPLQIPFKSNFTVKWAISPMSQAVTMSCSLAVYEVA